MKFGLKFPLNGEYRPLTISPNNPHKCWEPSFQTALREIAGDTYPQADYKLDGREPCVVFSEVNARGAEIIGCSKDYNQRKPSRAEVRRIQRQIEEIHRLARDSGIPADRREFFENFQLPDPWKMPECWRVTGGIFHRRVHILWGLAKGKNSTFLPTSSGTHNWKDEEARRPLEQVVEIPPRSETERASGDGTRHIEKHASGNAQSGNGSDASSDTPRRNGRRSGRARGCLANLIVWGLALGLLFLLLRICGCMPGCSSRLHRGGGPGSSGDDGKSSENGNKSSTCDGPSVKMEPPVVPKAFKCAFKVNPPRMLSGSNDDVAQVEFSVSPLDDLGGRQYEVSNWQINGEIKQRGAADLFAPPNGLRTDKTYTITAAVTMDGVPQRVEPYQWNKRDEPTWQIIEFNRSKEGKRQYKLVCCNSSDVEINVQDWKVAFRAGGEVGERSLTFEGVEKNPLGQDALELDWSIGKYKGAYFVEITAAIQYNKTHTVKHTEVFPFTHDSSSDSLIKAKYEIVIPNIYFCLAKLDDGSLINGTAFAISKKLLLSNYHVAVGGIPESYANSGEYKVEDPVKLTNVEGKTFYARVEQADRERDLALLRLCDEAGKDTDDKLAGYLHLADEEVVNSISKDSPRPVFAIGYPKGTVCMGPPAFTDGKAEEIDWRNYVYRNQKQAVKTIFHYTNTECGYSGGPLIDYQTGSVLGVNFGGFFDLPEGGHKAASLATSVSEVYLAFPSLRSVQ